MEEFKNHYGLCCIFLMSQLFISDNASASPRNLVCYVETWANEREPPMDYDSSLNALPPKMCNYLVVLFVTLDASSNQLLLHNSYTKVTPDNLRKAVESRQHSPDLKVLLAVGGWEDEGPKYSIMLADKNLRVVFISSVVQMLEEYGFDGLELHWFYPGVLWRYGKPEDKENYVQLLKELHMMFKPRKWLLTAMVPAEKDIVDEGYDIKRINRLVHQMHVRTLDLRGIWTLTADNPSPLFGKPATEREAVSGINVKDALEVLIRMGASRRKLIPIFPTFGRSLVLVDQMENKPGSPIDKNVLGRGGKFTREPGVLAYYEICELLKDNRIEPQFEMETMTPFIVDGNQWIGYDNIRSLESKITFVRNHGYGGVGLHALSMDDFNGTCGDPYILLKKCRYFLNE